MWHTYYWLAVVAVNAAGCLAAARLLRRRVAGYPCTDCRGEMAAMCRRCTPLPAWSQPGTFEREVA